MRKLKLQVQMTIDGFVAGPNGELDWIKSKGLRFKPSLRVLLNFFNMFI